MAKKDLRFLIGRALTDDKFKTRLRKNPRAAANECNCSITDDQVEAIEGMSLQEWKKIESVVYDTMIATSDCIA